MGHAGGWRVPGKTPLWLPLPPAFLGAALHGEGGHPQCLPPRGIHGRGQRARGLGFSVVVLYPGCMLESLMEIGGRWGEFWGAF